MIVLVAEYIVFELISIYFQDIFRELWTDSLMITTYSPDVISVLLTFGVSITLYSSFISLVPWMMGNLEISTFRNREDLIGFNRFVTKSWFIRAIFTITLMAVPISIVYIPIMANQPQSFIIYISEAIVIVYSAILSQHLWKGGFERLEKKPLNPNPSW